MQLRLFQKIEIVLIWALDYMTQFLIQKMNQTNQRLKTINTKLMQWNNLMMNLLNPWLNMLLLKVRQKLNISLSKKNWNKKLIKPPDTWWIELIAWIQDLPRKCPQNSWMSKKLKHKSTFLKLELQKKKLVLNMFKNTKQIRCCLITWRNKWLMNNSSQW